MRKLMLLLMMPLALIVGIQTSTAKTKTPASPQAKWDHHRPETLQGTITIVQPGKKKVFVTGSNKASFKFLVNNKTKIKVGGNTSTMVALANQTDKQVTVTFVPRRKGDIAQSITVSG